MPVALCPFEDDLRAIAGEFPEKAVPCYRAPEPALKWIARREREADRCAFYRCRQQQGRGRLACAMLVKNVVGVPGKNDQQFSPQKVAACAVRLQVRVASGDLRSYMTPFTAVAAAGFYESD